MEESAQAHGSGYIGILDSDSGRTWSKSVAQRLEAHSLTAYDHDPAIRAGAWKNINDDLLALDTLRSSICVRRNAYVLACRLPPDVLSTIFHLLVDMWPIQPAFQGSDPDMLGWIRVTHVCRKWREVACGDPELWAAGVVGFPLKERWTLEMMCRTKSFSLCFELKWVNNPPRRRLDFVFTKSLLKIHLGHIRDLHLEIHDCRSMDDLLPVLSYPAPRLKRATFHTGISRSIIFPLHSFAGHFPCLRILDLGHMPVRLDSDILNSSCLEELCAFVQGSVLGEPYQATMHSLTAAISKFSNLRVLRLSGNLPPLTSDFQCPTPIILSRLSLLGINERISQCIAVLDALEIPPTCTLDIECSPDYLDSDDMSQSDLLPALLSVGSHLRRNLCLPSIQTFSAEVIVDLEDLRLSGWRCVPEDTTAWGVPWKLQSSEAAFILTLKLYADEVDMNALWGEIQAMLPLQDTRYLSIRGFGFDGLWPVWNKGWINDLSSFEAVTHCCICIPLPDLSLDLPTALQRRASSNPSQPDLPSLTSLYVRSENRPDLHPGNVDHLLCNWWEWQHSLYEALATRKRIGFGIEELVLEHWAVPDPFEDQLQLEVPTVIFSECELIDDLWPDESE